MPEEIDDVIEGGRGEDEQRGGGQKDADTHRQYQHQPIAEGRG